MKGQSLTDGQESRTTEEILPLTTRMDMECQTLLPTEGNFLILIAGATPDKDKNDDGTRTAWTACGLLGLLGLWILVM